MNNYQAYQFNIYQLINTFKLKYNWINIEEEIFYNGIKNHSKPYDYKSLQETNNWLKKYASNQLGLGQEILKDGMQTPIFYTTINNQKYIVIGRHRYYSLLFNSKIKPLNKKFLFIELPIENKQLDIEQELYYFDKFQIRKTILKTTNQINDLLFSTGDNLTPYLWEHKEIKPFEAFQDEKKFEKWLQEDFKI